MASKRRVRWSLAAILTTAAAVDVYLALSESVWWPLTLAPIWLGFAAALLLPAPEPVTIPMPRTAREALSLEGWTLPSPTGLATGSAR
ncbi:hypothetical protein [Actinokineospora terrae]|uniref:Uncharacterized protein n=1 Tax=Actinokineospora terrae TaxID=155974 RepID=A0A1H9TQ74_9PSEU|nr:hypothetical protein [Actinokineospora terrae]SER99228.1 hypothetical protein SAMN04487818_106407 [Actinokineospora terrae]